eukprot:XP_006523539.1 PREDICTED: transcription initiation protein SPT3 homolog isoform X3 [Mus musculus]
MIFLLLLLISSFKDLLIQTPYWIIFHCWNTSVWHRLRCSLHKFGQQNEVSALVRLPWALTCAPAILPRNKRFSLGDARRPLHETAVLVEDVVHTQLINLLQQAAEVSQLRGARVISAEDLLFLMRKDKKKLRRLLKYMFIRDYKSKIIKGIDEDDLLEEKLSGSSGTNKRQKIAQDLINSIDQTGELLAMFEDNELDDVKQERMERAERQTRTMDSAQYAEFCESRQLSFSKKASKFRDWLDCSSMEIKPNVIAMEILAYLAYETVAQLVDLALLVRQDMVSKAGDPFSHAISATFIQYHNSAEGSSCLKSSPDSPENTPPPTPTAPSSGSQHSEHCGLWCRGSQRCHPALPHQRGHSTLRPQDWPSLPIHNFFVFDRVPTEGVGWLSWPAEGTMAVPAATKREWFTEVILACPAGK